MITFHRVARRLGSRRRPRQKTVVRSCRVEAVERRTMLSSVLAPDATFGTDGKSAVEFPSARFSAPHAILALPGGKILVGGSVAVRLEGPVPVQDVARGAVVRLN